MAITVTEAAYEPASVSTGPVKFQFVEVVANSGATSGTITASRIKDLYHVLCPGLPTFTAATTYSGNVATLAFTVPAETAATLTTQGLTLTAIANLGSSGNNITVAFTGGGTAGSEVVTVVGNAISVQIQSGTSTVTQVRTAMQASAACTALVTTTGTSSSTVSTAAATPLAGGIDGGYKGTALCIGRGNGAST